MKKTLLALIVFSGFTNQALSEDIKIGIAGPFTGPVADYGIGMIDGVNAAANIINSRGGINGNNIIIIQGDDVCDPKQAVAVARKLSEQDEVIGVIGHLCSSSTIPAFDIYNETGVIALTPGSTNPEVTAKGYDNIFRVTGRDDQQSVIAADFITKREFKNIAILHDKDSYGRGIADQLKSNLNKSGLNEVMFEGINPGEKDYSTIVTKMRSIRPDALFWGGYHPEAAVLIREMRKQGLDIPFIGADGIYGNLPDVLRDDALTKNVFASFSKDFTKLPENREVLQYFEDNNIKINAFTLPSYAALQALAEALENGETTNGAIDYLHNNEFNTVVGNIKFDQKGDLVESGYVMYEYIGSEMVEVE